MSKCAVCGQPWNVMHGYNNNDCVPSDEKFIMVKLSDMTDNEFMQIEANIWDEYIEHNEKDKNSKFYMEEGSRIIPSVNLREAILPHFRNLCPDLLIMKTPVAFYDDQRCVATTQMFESVWWNIEEEKYPLPEDMEEFAKKTIDVMVGEHEKEWLPAFYTLRYTPLIIDPKDMSFSKVGAGFFVRFGRIRK